MVEVVDAEAAVRAGDGPGRVRNDVDAPDSDVDLDDLDLDHDVNAPSQR